MLNQEFFKFPECIGGIVVKKPKIYNHYVEHTKFFKISEIQFMKIEQEEPNHYI